MKIDIQLQRFNDTILNLFQKFVPNDKDLVWMTKKVRSKLKCRNELYKI